MSWENLLLPYANNKDADQPAHSRSLTSTIVVHCLDSIIPLVSISESSSCHLASMAGQVGSQTPKTGFLVTRLIFPQMYTTNTTHTVLVLHYSGQQLKWASTWQNQQNGCAPSEDSDQPGHLPSLIWVFAVHMTKAWVLSYPLSIQPRLWSDWANAQADLSLRWGHTHFVGFVMSWLKLRKLITKYLILLLT